MSQTTVLHFEKIIDGVAIRCTIAEGSDGNVEISGDEIDTWIFEFCENALERAVFKVESEGYICIGNASEEK